MKTKSKNNNSNLLVKVMVALMAVMVLFSAFSPLKAMAHSTYFLAVTINESDARYEPMILFDDSYWNQRHHSHRESKVGYFGEYKYTSVDLPGMEDSESTTVEKALEDYSDGDYETGGTGNAHLIFSFPGYHGTKDYDSTAKDRARAEWVASTMVQSLNDAIAFVTQKAEKKPNKYELIYLATNLANLGYQNDTDSFEYGGVTVEVTGDYELDEEDKKEMREEVEDVNKDAYAKITITGTGVAEETRIFVSKVPKGYKSNQPLFDSMPTELQELHDAKNEPHGFSEDVTSLTWKHAVLQAHYSFSENEITYEQFDKISKPNKVEQLFTEMGEGFLLMLRTVLGLQSFSDLMLNEGARGGAGYFLGIMPMAWLDSASILHWTSMALSWLLIMFAFVRVLALRNLAAINIAKRVDMVDGIKNLIVVGFALMLFNPIFYTLANFNWLLVEVMKNTSNVTSSFGTTAPGAGLLAKLFINFAYFIMEIYFNFIYISRGIIVAILYGVGPLFIASLAFGPKYAQIFSNYVRELVGTIYMQTFHAILVAFFASVTIFGGVRLFEQLVVLFAFIPLTKFFREAIGVGGGVADIAGAGAFGAVGDMAKMGTKSARQTGGKYASNMKSSKQAGNSAPMTQTKSSSSFTQSGGTSGGGSMAKVDNDYGSSAKGTSQQGKGTTNGMAQSKSGGGMANVDGDAPVSMKKQMAGDVLGAGASFIGMGGAVGMSAVGGDSVSKTMTHVKPKHQKSGTTGSNNGKQNQNNKKPKAPQEVFENSGYAGSEISDNQNTVNHKFRKTEEDGSSGMYDDYGITDVRQEKEGMVYEYDYDVNSNSFNSGTYNDGQQALKMQDMNKVFNSKDLSPEQVSRKSQYESQGIQSVKQNGNRMEIRAKNGTGGIHGVGNKNDMYQFHKNNGDNGSVNMLDAIQYAESQNNGNPNQ